ncbi:unnamed protein product [Schistocephalus solidus]|uniref:Uncharacterized protein n=1 Tax=Schistocephalus solidus TaxID=70667 RepID=A0A3P7BVX2_SCHSO|nr:unnamed protein product [Schistocephalus solidus]
MQRLNSQSVERFSELTASASSAADTKDSIHSSAFERSQRKSGRRTFSASESPTHTVSASQLRPEAAPAASQSLEMLTQKQQQSKTIDWNSPSRLPALQKDQTPVINVVCDNHSPQRHGRQHWQSPSLTLVQWLSSADLDSDTASPSPECLRKSPESEDGLVDPIEPNSECDGSSLLLDSRPKLSSQSTFIISASSSEELTEVVDISSPLSTLVFNRQRTEQPQESFDSQKYAVPGLPWFEPSLSPQPSDIESEEEGNEREGVDEIAEKITSKPEFVLDQAEGSLNSDDISPEFHTAHSYDLADGCQRTPFATSRSFEEVILTEEGGAPPIHEKKIVKVEVIENTGLSEIPPRKEAWRNQVGLLAEKDGDSGPGHGSSPSGPSVDSGIVTTSGTQVSTTRGLTDFYTWSLPVTAADEEQVVVGVGQLGGTHHFEAELEKRIILSLTCLHDQQAALPSVGADSGRLEGRADYEELDSPNSTEDYTLTDATANEGCLEDDGTDRDFDDVDVIGDLRGLSKESRSEDEKEEEDGVTGHPVSMFYRLEQMRFSLEETIGMETLLRCYNVVHALQENEDDEMRLSREAVAKIMGPEKAAVYFDRVLQLVLADSAFTGDRVIFVYAKTEVDKNNKDVCLGHKCAECMKPFSANVLRIIK